MTEKEMIYPVSEMFLSPQGEGMFAGVMMWFIRLAGCTVGKPFPKEMYSGLGEMSPQFPIYTEKCTLYDGREFPCDTDYRVNSRLPTANILDAIPGDIERVCITGGEPLMHNHLKYLVEAIRRSHPSFKRMVHLETSGTIRRVLDLPASGLWITVSPKKGCLPEVVGVANEIKLLVDEYFDWDKVPDFIKQHATIYIQPVNGEHTVNVDNLRRCRELQARFPRLRLSLQLHKVLEKFLIERVR